MIVLLVVPTKEGRRAIFITFGIFHPFEGLSEAILSVVRANHPLAPLNLINCWYCIPFIADQEKSYPGL